MNGAWHSLFDGQGTEFKTATSRHHSSSQSHLRTTRSAIGDVLKLLQSKKSWKRINRRSFLLKSSNNDKSNISQEVQLEFRQQLVDFAKNAQTMTDPTSFHNAVTPESRASMRYIISRMLGTVSHQYFDIRYSSVSANKLYNVAPHSCAQSTEQCKTLFLSILISGYMLKNAQDRVDLTRKLRQHSKNADRRQTQARTHGVTGDVVRWKDDHCPQSIPAKDYIADLEAKIEKLEQLESERYQSGTVDPLVEYMRTLDNHRLEELANGASEDVLLAMHVCTDELLSSDKPESGPMMCSLPQREMFRLMEWLMTFGYNLRCKELKHDMEKAFLMDNSSEMQWF